MVSQRSGFPSQHPEELQGAIDAFAVQPDGGLVELPATFGLRSASAHVSGWRNSTDCRRFMDNAPTLLKAV